MNNKTTEQRECSCLVKCKDNQCIDAWIEQITGESPETNATQQPCSARCGWEYINGKRCGKPAAGIWTIITSTHVCKHHAQEVNRKRMGKVSMLSNSQANPPA